MVSISIQNPFSLKVVSKRKSDPIYASEFKSILGEVIDKKSYYADSNNLHSDDYQVVVNARALCEQPGFKDSGESIKPVNPIVMFKRQLLAR